MNRPETAGPAARSAAGSSPEEPGHWDRRYRQGVVGWELGRPAPPLQRFLAAHPRAPRPPGVVLVSGCGRGHEAALLEELGFTAIGLDFSGEALAETRARHGDERAGLRWLQADLLDRQALEAAGLTPGSLGGVLEHTCFCAIDPGRRDDYIATVRRLLAPGWLLGLFWCHGRPDGPPWGGDPEVVAAQLVRGGLEPELWEPATGSVEQRQDEWLGLWRRPRPARGPRSG